MPELVQTVQKRNLQLARAKDESANVHLERGKNHKKYPGMPVLSFMRDTSSSRKKQSAPGGGFPNLRASSNMEAYSRRTRLQTLTKKRQLSKSSKVNQADSSNMDIDFGDRPTVFSTDSPSGNMPLRPLHYALSDECTRLLNTTSMPSFNLPRERSRNNLSANSQKSLGVSPETQLLLSSGISSGAESPHQKQSLHSRPTTSTQRLQKSFSNGNIGYHSQSPSQMQKSSSRGTLNLKRAECKTKTREVRKNPSSSEQSPEPKAKTKKPCTVNEVFKFINKADPSFFREVDLPDNSIEAQSSLPPTALLNSEKGKALNMYERGEIIRSSKIYYIPEPQKPHEVSPDVNISNFKDNYGFDDVDGNYIVKPRGHIEYRYEIMSTLGTGSFGNVVLCKDHKYHAEHRSRYVAIKIIKNDLNWSLQAVSEIKMLKHLTRSTGPGSGHIMTYCDHFHFRGHMCIVTEALSLNLYTLLELGKFRGLSLNLVKTIMSQILKGMEYIHNQKVIHCDIKPENIMVKLPASYKEDTDYNETEMKIKIIDFGSSCFEEETSFSYIQSRFYRAPEVILGALYSYQIDIWSVGCVCAELFTGNPLLPGRHELDQIALMLEMFGSPASTCIINERKKLLKHIKGNIHKSLKDALASDATTFTANKMYVDEKKLKKTLLYSLFNMEGKVNLQFLNLQLQSMDLRDSDTRATSPFKRNVKLGSRSIEVALRLLSSGETKRDQMEFTKFIASMLQWDPKERATFTQLLHSKFILGL